MWCEKCEKEYDGFDLCPVCGTALVDSTKPAWAWSRYGRNLEKWPQVDGEPEPPVFLKCVSSLNLEDVMLMNMLEAYGIPSLRQYPNDGQFGRVILGTPATGVEIYVPESMYTDARGLVDGGNDDEELH